MNKQPQFVDGNGASEAALARLILMNADLRNLEFQDDGKAQDRITAQRVHIRSLSNVSIEEEVLFI